MSIPISQFIPPPVCPPAGLLILHNLHVYRYPFKCTQCYFCRKHLTMGMCLVPRLKPQLWKAGKQQPCRARFTPFLTGEEVETQDRK